MPSPFSGWIAAAIYERHAKGIRVNAVGPGLIDALNASLSEKIEKVDERRAAGDTDLGDRIDELTERVSKLSGQLSEILGRQK